MVLSQLFRRGQGSSRLEQELAALEEQAGCASSGYETQFLNRAGTLCLEAGQPARALGYFGRAIDTYLETGRFAAAEVLCRRMVQISPGVVRARCTLAWLEIGRGHPAGAREAITAYVQAAHLAGQEPLAARQLLMMAEAAVDPGVREELAHALRRCGAGAAADRLERELELERSGRRSPPILDESALWIQVLRGANMPPEELRRQPGPAMDAAPDDLPSLTDLPGS